MLRYFTLLLAITGLISPAVAATRTTTADSSCRPGPDASCIGKTCSDVGTTTLDGNGESLIACLKTRSGHMKWQRMTGEARLDCTVASRQSGGVTVISGSKDAVQPVGVPDPNSQNPWGIQCTSGYLKTGCYSAWEGNVYTDSTGYAKIGSGYNSAVYDNDIGGSGMSCTTGDEEASMSSILSIVCCRVVYD